MADKTLVHALRDCSKAREVLVIGGIDNRLLNSKWNTSIDWLEKGKHLVEERAFECFVMLLWNILNSRNSFIFRGLDENPRVVCKRALNFCRDFRIYNFNNPVIVPRAPPQRRWSKPPSGILKINFDAVWCDRKTRIGHVQTPR